MNKERTVVEEEGDVVEQISHQQDFSNVDKTVPSILGDVVALTPSPQQVKGQKADVDDHAQRAGVPDGNVANQMDLSLSERLSINWPN